MPCVEDGERPNGLNPDAWVLLYADSVLKMDRSLATDAPVTRP